MQLINNQRTLIVIPLIVMLSACATQPESSSSEVPGFLYGLLHGFIIMFSLIGSLFTEYRVYAFPNSGFLYDLGYFFGILLLLGGGGAGAKQKKKKIIIESDEQ